MYDNVPSDKISQVQRFIRTKHPPYERPESGMTEGNMYATLSGNVGNSQPSPSTGRDPFSFSCLDVANHVKDCPICSKFYNNDKSLYIILIVLLSIICVLLIKRVLNV